MTRVVKTGNMGLGVITGFIAMVIIGWIPVVGAFIAGIIAGAIAKGSGRGMMAGFLSGIFGLVLLAFLFTALGGSIGGGIGALVGGLFGIGVSSLLGLISIGGIILVTIGGLIGGSLEPRVIEKSGKYTKADVENDDDEGDEQPEDAGDDAPRVSGKPDEEHMKILKLRYAKGEITKKQFEAMKKDLGS